MPVPSKPDMFLACRVLASVKPLVVENPPDFESIKITRLSRKDPVPLVKVPEMTVPLSVSDRLPRPTAPLKEVSPFPRYRAPRE